MRHKWKCKVPRCIYFFVFRVFSCAPGANATVVEAGVCAHCVWTQVKLNNEKIHGTQGTKVAVRSGRHQ